MANSVATAMSTDNLADRASSYSEHQGAIIMGKCTDAEPGAHAGLAAKEMMVVESKRRASIQSNCNKLMIYTRKTCMIIATYDTTAWSYEDSL